MIDINKIKQGDIFSESSHYKVLDKDGTRVKFQHIETNEAVVLDNRYVQEILVTGDQYTETKEVGREDKQNGDFGIRSIWENIHGTEVFTVCYKKQDEPLSQKKFNELKSAQVSEAIKEIEATAVAKKGVANKAKEVLTRIQENPILPYKEGESRMLRGYKIQFSSRDGKYKCIDMDLLDGQQDNNSSIRPVNINTIEYLIYKGIKYIVK